MILLAKLLLLLVPLVLKRIVDQLALKPSLALVPVALLVSYGAARIGNTLFTELRQVVFAPVMARVSRRVTLRVFEHLHSLSLAFHLDLRTGGVARDVERGGAAVTDLLDYTIYSVLPTVIEVVLVTVVLVWAYDWGFAAITLATLAAYSIWTFSVTEWRTRFFRAAVDADTRANERAVDSLLNYETVKYFNNEVHEAALYDERLRALEIARVKAQRTLSVLNLGQTVAVSVGVTAMMWRAAAGVVAGRLTVGDLVLVNTYTIQLSAPLFLLGMVYREVKQALVMERLFGLLDQPRCRTGPARKCCTCRARGSISKRCASATTRAARSCTASTSRSRRAAPWRWSATRARASRPSRGCSTASTTSTRARSGSTGATCASSRRTRFARRSRSSRRTPSCSTTRSTTTSATAAPTRPVPRSRPPRAPRTSTRSSSRCPTATTPRWASAGSSSPAARSNAWQSRALS
jgi:ABC-type multidrug transport system fused ATPase/permease subunit